MDDARYMLARCGSSRGDFVVRLKFIESAWFAIGGFKVRPNPSPPKGSEAHALDSGFEIGPEYACPYCEATGFVQCGSCGRLNCWAEQPVTTCTYCGDQGAVDFNSSIQSVSIASG